MSRSQNTGTVYFGLQCSRNRFDLVAQLSVEGVDISAIARVAGITWNTAARWQGRAASAATNFNNQRVRDIELIELQADELRTTLDGKDEPIWVFTAIEVWSRVWPSHQIGRRSYRNAQTVLQDVVKRSVVKTPPLIATDGFKYYSSVIRGLFGAACVYGQVVKTWRNNRVHSVDRRLVVGTEHRLAAALESSEDSQELNTSFAERLNLTLRRGCSTLHRRTPSHARSQRRLRAQVGLFQCYYNFGREHWALRVGLERRTPAMQAHIADHRFSFREIFLSTTIAARIYTG